MQYPWRPEEGNRFPVNYSIVHVSHHVNLSWSWARAVSALITSVMSPALRKYRKAKPGPTDPLSTEALSVVASTVHLLRQVLVLLLSTRSPARQWLVAH